VLTVGELMCRAAAHNADRMAVISGDRRLTFAQAWTRGIRLANALLEMGLRPGDRVGVLEDNSLESQDFFAGAAIANLARVPLYGRDSRQAHAHNLGHTNCRVLVVSANYAQDVKGLEDELPDLERIVVRDEGYEDWLAGFSDQDPRVLADTDDVHVIRHTGGTTGRAKGVAYSHRKWLASGRDWTYRLPPIEAGDRCLHVSPISHGSGYLYLPMWLQGAANILVASAEPGATLALIERERVNFMFAVPTVVNSLGRHALAGDGRYNFGALKAMLVGGAPISETTALQGRKVFGPVLYQIYGQAECQPGTVMGPEEWFAEVPGSKPLRSAGRPLAFSGLQIRDPDGNALPAGEQGEIALRCEGQMDGYWGDPELSARRVVDGWVLTSDIGKVDRNGYLYILDRKDDMIIPGGSNIWSAELENAIAKHPAVVEVAVFGAPHERWGETPVAVCVVADPATVTAEEIIRLCADELGSYKKPAVVHFQSGPLPKSPVGKIQRKALRERFWTGADRRVSGS